MDIMSILSWKEAPELEEVTIGADHIELKLKSTTLAAACPLCHQFSSCIHSHYRRRIADLPWASKSMIVSLRVRRFRCQNQQCSRKIFSERLESTPAYGRRTKRMQQQLAQIGYQLGGQAGAQLATLLGMPISDTTLIRILKATENISYTTPKVLGVDDWSIKKGQTYGTILVDMEKQKAIDLLPDREADTLATWLKAHPGVEIISRDRANCYAEGAKQGAPEAIQVADRWHLLKNLGEALKRMLEKWNPQLRLVAKELAAQQQQQKQEEIQAAGIIGPTVSLSSPTAQRALLFQEVKKLLEEGYKLKTIARRLHISRNTVRRYRHYDQYPAKSIPDHRKSTVLPWKEHLTSRWEEGERNIKQLWREIQQQGYSGSAGSVYRFFEYLPKDAETLPLPELLVKNWTPTKVQYLISKKEKELTEEEQSFLAVFFQKCPKAELARNLALSFRTIFEQKDAKALPDWIQQAKNSGIPALKNFSVGLEADYEAVKAAATHPWSNGQVEGQVNRLKMIKRQMYGRAGFDLLRKRVVFTPDTG